MNWKALLILILLGATTNSFGQTVFHRYFEKKILPGYRISGNLDSVDAKLSVNQTNLPGSFNPLNSNFSYSDLFRYKPYALPKRISSIPHVAFGYSMGSRLYQVGKITYTQTIDTNSFLQFDYNRLSSNGAMQRNAFESNQVNWSFMHRGVRYGTKLDFLFFSGNYNINGGLLGDSLSSGLDLIYQSVKKENASRIYKTLQVNWNNYFSFIKSESDSLIGKKAGVMAGVNYGISNNRYQETDTLAGIYSMINYDSTSTNDYWEKTTIAFPLGLFYSSELVSLQLGTKYLYWDYDNLINHLDTTEMSLFTELDGSWRSLTYKLKGAYTLSGAKGEQEYLLHVNKTWSKMGLNFKLNYSSKYPELFQRTFYGNNASYNWSNKVLTNALDAQFAFSYENSIIPLELKAYYYNADKTPRYYNNAWYSDTVFSFVGINLKASYSFKRLLIQIQGALQQSSADFLPKTVVNGRIAYNGPLFKAKKLKTVTGIEIGQIGTYNALTYVPYMHSYQYASQVKEFVNMPKLHFYTSFDLGYFRWFVRVENIEQLIIRSKNQEALGYQVVPMQIRFGVSWDFFN